MAREVRLDWSGRTSTPGESPPPAPRARIIKRGAARILFGDALNNTALLAVARRARAPRVRQSAARVSRGAPRRRRRRPHAPQRRLPGIAGAARRRGRLPRHAGAAARGAWQALLRDDGTLWSTSTGGLRTWCASCWTGYRSRALQERDSVWRRAPNLGPQAASSTAGARTMLRWRQGRVAADAARTNRGPRRALRRRGARVHHRAEGRLHPARPSPSSRRRGRVHRTSSGRVYIEFFLVEAGKSSASAASTPLWTDVAPLRRGPPVAQKPRALFDRIVRCATPEGGRRGPVRRQRRKPPRPRSHSAAARSRATSAPWRSRPAARGASAPAPAIEAVGSAAPNQPRAPALRHAHRWPARDPRPAEPAWAVDTHRPPTPPSRRAGTPSARSARVRLGLPSLADIEAPDGRSASARSATTARWRRPRSTSRPRRAALCARLRPMVRAI